MTTMPRASARDRLLDAADELFYEEGVHSVGIDRVIERAGVAKASLYNAFGSKDELIQAYLERRLAARKARMERGLARFDDTRERLLGVFDVLGEVIAEPAFRGCAFVNARAESAPDSKASQTGQTSREWTRTLFTDLARAAGVPEPEPLAAQLALLYDGATVDAGFGRDVTVARTAKAAAAVLLAAAI